MAGEAQALFFSAIEALQAHQIDLAGAQVSVGLRIYQNRSRNKEELVAFLQEIVRSMSNQRCEVLGVEEVMYRIISVGVMCGNHGTFCERIFIRALSASIPEVRVFIC